MHVTRAPYTLDSSALALVGALARPLCLWPAAMGRSFASFAGPLDSLAGKAPAEDDEEDDYALVSIRGPLAQRGEMQMCGAIDGYDWITMRLAEALSSARSVVLVIDSPGGEGAGLAEAVRRMRALVEASGKPVLAYVDELAASAAYWIASGVADKVFVPSTGQVGSIGAIAVHVDESVRAEKKGYAYTVIRSPEGKAAGTSVEPLSDTGRARIERSVTDLAERFTSEIAARRGISTKTIKALDADVLTGSAAVDAGLADGVASLEETISRAVSLAAQKENDMKLRDSIAKMVGASASATDEELMAGVEEAAPLLNLGRKVAAVTGLPDADSAFGTVSAWKSGAADATRLAAELASRAATAEAQERLELVKAAAAAGKSGFLPVEAWADPVLGEAGGIHAEFADMPIKTLRAKVARAPAIPGLATRTAPDPKTALDGIHLTAGEEDDARRYGISREAMLAQKRRNLQGRN